MRGIRLRGLKTFSAARCDAVHSQFLPLWMKQHLFDGSSQFYEHHNEAERISLSNSSNTSSTAEAMKLPNLYGNTIQTHIEALSRRHASPYRNLLDALATAPCPPIPTLWLLEPGWTCYRVGSAPYHVDFPDEDALIFDTEVCVQESFAPVLATAVSSTAWYSWVSPVLTHNQGEKKSHVFISDLVPLGDQGLKPRVVVGHHVCFDAARIQECYNLPMKGLKFFDTMSAHVAVSGVSDLQRFSILSASEKPDWAKLASGNSLSQLFSLYCGSNLSKTERDVFVNGSLSDIVDQFQELCTYCALDVKATHSVYCELLPLFLDRFPHGASVSALLEMSSMFVPVSGNWENVLEDVTQTSSGEQKVVSLLLEDLASDALKLMENNRYRHDPWMWDQDWSVASGKQRQENNQPQWYKKFRSQANSIPSDEVDIIHINFRKNIIPKLMQLSWGRYPLHYEPSHGWGMLIPALKSVEEQVSKVPVKSVVQYSEFFKTPPRITSTPSVRDFISLHSGITAANSGIKKRHFNVKDKGETFQSFIQNGLLFKKLPHPVSLEKKVGGALSVPLLTNSCLRSSNSKAQRILSILRKNVFWKRNGKSFQTVPVVWLDKKLSEGAVVPSASACGDFIRHPKEIIFSSLCHEEAGSTGIEISSALRAPVGWCFLSANIPQCDLWMTALLADSTHGNYCASSIGQLFVQGKAFESISKNLKLSPHQFEFLFHAVIWGGSRKYLTKLLREINPILSYASVDERIAKLFQYFFRPPNELGEASEPVGVLHEFQEILRKLLESPRICTPILESRLSRVLEGDPQKYSALIQNWLVRSSVADYLHVLMLCFHDFLPNARLCTASSYPLMIKYLVPDDRKYYAAKSLHTAHLYSTAFCAAQLGLADVPKVAAELPFVTLSPYFRIDVSAESQNVTFEEAFKNSETEC